MSQAIETEIKIRLPGTAADAARLLEQHGYRVRSPRSLQIDRVFDLPGDPLRQSSRLLRVRSENGQATLTYKGPALPGPHKQREEVETRALDGDALVRILERLGYAPTFRYEKYRTTFSTTPDGADAPGVVVLDETPIGIFLELEGPPDWIDRTAAQLGFDRTGYITASYATLYREHLKIHSGPADMTFTLAGT